jgi:peptidoglycan/LPS O-acetylase OafA/YrhL
VTSNSRRLSSEIDPRFTDRERQPGLDLLRALAIIVVVIYHAGIMGFPLPNDVHRFGWIGVDLFFVLSGYLIGGQLLAPLARGQRFNLRRFFARRALRILPAYFFILAIYVFLPSWREYPEMFPPWKFLLSVQNIGLRGGTAFSHAWSLGVEDQFYLLLPLVLLCLIRWRRAAMIVPCAIVIGGLALRWFLARQNLTETGVWWRAFQTWIYYATWTRLDPLVFGVGLAAIEKFRPHWWQRLMNLAPWLGLPGLALIVYAFWIEAPGMITVTTSIWQFPLIALGMAALLVCALSPRLPFRRVSVPGAAFIASIAYSAYLVQKLVIHFVAQWLATQNIALTSFPAIIGIQLCVYAGGTILFFTIERPFLRLRHRLVPRS